MPLLALLTLIILISLFIVLYEKNAPFRDNPIGKRQFDLLKTYTKAEAALFYIDQSAKYSLQQAVYDLAQNGGVSELEFNDFETFSGSDCGSFNGAYVWYELRKDKTGYVENSCFDENILNTHLIYYFNTNLNDYLQLHPHNIPLNNYQYDVKDNLEIIAKAHEPLKFSILKIEINEEIRTNRLLKEPAKIVAEAATIQGNLKEFTSTPICAKGSRCILTDESFNQLIKAQEKAKQKGVSLEVYSSYRSQSKQEALWFGKTPENYAARYVDENIRRKYVCDPRNGEKSCPHMSGKVVDIRLRGKTTRTMMSSDWRLLHEIMTSKDEDNNPLWVRYANEPWHFECCNTPRYERAMRQGVTVIV